MSFARNKPRSGIIDSIPERGRYILMNYAKAVAAVVATVLTAVVAALGGGISPNEWVNIAIAGVGAASVFAAPNVPGAQYTKTILAVLAAVLTFLASLALGGGLSQADVLQIVIVALGALGVYAVPNKAYALDAAEGP